MQVIQGIHFQHAIFKKAIPVCGIPNRRISDDFPVKCASDELAIIDGAGVLFVFGEQGFQESGTRKICAKKTLFKDGLPDI
jgi:hypothetical protein